MKETIGDACAYLGPDPKRPGKGRYVTIGKAFKEGTRLSIKIDSLPVEAGSWQGWINIFERPSPAPATSKAQRPFIADRPKTGTSFDDMDDDIPF